MFPRTTPRRSVFHPGSRGNAAAYVLGNALGIAGFVLDGFGHLGMLASTWPGHTMMALGGLTVLVSLSAPWDRSSGAWVAVAGVAVGMFALLVSPLLVVAILLVVPRALWRRRSAPPEGRGIYAVAVGLGLVVAGGVVDAVWHLQNPHVGEAAENVFLLPGHQIQLAGWVVGLLSVGLRSG